jgi:hypothetical protein
MLVLLAIAAMMAAGGLTTLTTTSQPAAHAEALAISPADFQPSDECAADSALASTQDDSDKVPPGCCTTQCNVDKDCDKRCGKGVCVCMQQTPCCRRCVY